MQIRVSKEIPHDCCRALRRRKLFVSAFRKKHQNDSRSHFARAEDAETCKIDGFEKVSGDFILMSFSFLATPMSDASHLIQQWLSSIGSLFFSSFNCTMEFLLHWMLHSFSIFLRLSSYRAGPQCNQKITFQRKNTMEEKRFLLTTSKHNSLWSAISL